VRRARRALAAALVAAPLSLAGLSANHAAVASGHVLRLFVGHTTPPQRGAVETWRIAIFNSGAGAATGFGASGRVSGATVTGIDCPLTFWGGVGSLPTFFECGNNGGYRRQLGPGQVAVFSVTGTVTAGTGSQVIVTVHGIAAVGDQFQPASVDDAAVVVVPGAGLPTPFYRPTPTPTTAGATTGTDGARPVGSGAAYTLLLAAAFVITSAGLFLVFTRQRRRTPPGTPQG